VNIGFLGLGTMGTPMVQNLIKAGHQVAVWNRTPSRAASLRGVAHEPTPNACARGRELVICCLSDENALEAVLEGEYGVLSALAAGDVLVDCTTAGSASARTVEARVGVRGATFIAAPLLGSRGPAERGELTVVAGGPAEAIERARPALSAFSARIITLPSAPQAALMKLVVNCLGASMITGFCEALTLARSGGLSLADAVDAIQSSGFKAPFFGNKGEQVVKSDYNPRFSLALAAKDARLTQEAAGAQGARLPVNAAAMSLFNAAVASGRGEKDIAAVAELLFEWAGL
jgi:3-hydroxyisobutyrate dehydrogenase-like beta-hydroxyacid dehydrogenase